jgi:sortase B
MYNVIIALCVIVFLVAAALLLDKIYSRARVKGQYEALAGMMEDELTPHDMQGSVISLDKLRQINQDVVAWIDIEGTNIHYPVLQASDNDYYLYVSVYDEYADGGSIFMDYRNDPYFSDVNTVIYGHNMRNKTMFYDLRFYQDQSYFEARPYISVKIDNKILTYQIYSVRVLNELYDYRTPNYGTEEENTTFIADTMSSSVITSSVKPQAADKILTLSTCLKANDTSRLVIHAMLTNVEEF